MLICFCGTAGEAVELRVGGGGLQDLQLILNLERLNELFFCALIHIAYFFYIDLKKMVDKIPGSVSFLTRSCSTFTAVHFTASQIQCF